MSSTHARIAARMPGAWTAVTFTNSWVNYGGVYESCEYRKVGDRVELRGVIKSGTLSLSAFTLPSGYRPAATLQFVVANGGGAHFVAFLNINNVGQVAPLNYAGATNSDISLDGISFSTA